MTYAILLASNYLLYYASVATNYARSNIYAVLGLAPLTIAVVLRGDVGVDTAFYISIIESYADAETFDWHIEPIFLIYSKILLEIEMSPRFILNSLGLVNMVLIYYSFQKIEKSKAILILVVSPIFLLDYLMNGMRAGLAAGSIALAFQSAIHNRVNKFYLFSFFAVMSHISIIFVSVLMLSDLSKKIRIKITAILFIAIFLALFNSSELVTYLLLKSDAYLNSDAESILGLAPFALNLLLLCSLYLISKRRNFASASLSKLMFLGVVATILYLLVPLFPWFSARLMWLNLFYISLVSANCLSQSKLKINQLEYLSLLAVGILGLLSHIRQFYMAEGTGLSPFLPYKFFWS